MRVLFYLGDKEWSGSARATLTVARGLASRGHTVTLAYGAGSRLAREAGVADLDTIEIGASPLPLGDTLDLRNVLRDRFIEVAIVGNERDHLLVGSAMRLAERRGVLRRLSAFESIDLRSGGRLALRLASSGLVLSTEQELKALKAPGWAIPAASAPIGIDASEYDDVEPTAKPQLGVHPQALLIACSYDPSGRQRIATVFRTLALLAPRHVNVHAVIFGPGSDNDELRIHASALGVGPIVTFLGERADQRGVMRAATAGWVVSGRDDGAFACLDFMALRVPVIAEGSPLTHHYVANGITGLLLGKADPAYTASRVAAFLTAEERRVAMGHAGHTRVQREFAQTPMIDGFERAITTAGDPTKWTPQ
ncbi:MAG TPA: glycosyltransferase family 4 protein [Gemmatimonadaceae bacterium]